MDVSDAGWWTYDKYADHIWIIGSIFEMGAVEIFSNDIHKCWNICGGCNFEPLK